MRHMLFLLLLVAGPLLAAPATGPFADVPAGHWAYDAVQKAAQAGILQGWNTKFHGGRVVNRYQMAVVVARMLDRAGVLRASGKVLTATDIANLEALGIEFADELALVNVKISTLEDAVAGLKKDVDLIKADLRGVGARGGITGVMEARFANTRDNGPGYRFGPFTGPGAQSPAPAATTPLTRYPGQIVSGSGVSGSPFQFDSRRFFTVANFAIMLDREFDPHTHFHAQLNINAEGSADNQSENRGVASSLFPFGGIPSGAPLTDVRGVPVPFTDPSPGFFFTGPGQLRAGRGNSFLASAGLLVNELYVVYDDWFTTGVNGRIGIWALPMNTEVNGPGRTYLWTLTPSISNSKWESLRPVGLDVFQHDDARSFVFYAGFFTPGDTANGDLRSGTLLSAPTAPFHSLQQGPLLAVRTQASITPGPAVFNMTGRRFPTPLAHPAMTDAPRGVDGQTLDGSNVGFYAMVGQHPTCKDHRGLSWHVAYFDRNGDIHRDRGSGPTLTDWHAWQASASHQWKDVLLLAQYYGAQSHNYSFFDAGVPDADGNPASLVPDARRVVSTPFVNATGADTRSHSIMALVNWQFSRRGALTLRYEDAADTTGLARLEAEVWTLALNWRTSDHGWVQVEWLDPRSTAVSEDGAHNSADIHDGLVQVNYKLAW